MACAAHDYTADVRDRAKAAIAAVAELVEAVRDVYGDDCEQVCETSCPTCRIRRAIAKFGGAACTLRDAHPAPQQPAAVEVDDDGRDAPAQATQAVPQGWPRATKGQRDQGWTLEYRFLERVTDLAAPRTEYSTSMEATEQVLIAALEALAQQPADKAR